MFCSTCLDFREKSSDASSFIIFEKSCEVNRSFLSKQTLEMHLYQEALLLVSDEVKLKIKNLFDIAYMIAKLELKEYLLELRNTRIC